MSIDEIINKLNEMKNSVQSYKDEVKSIIWARYITNIQDILKDLVPIIQELEGFMNSNKNHDMLLNRNSSNAHEAQSIWVQNGWLNTETMSTEQNLQVWLDNFLANWIKPPSDPPIVLPPDGTITGQVDLPEITVLDIGIALNNIENFFGGTIFIGIAIAVTAMAWVLDLFVNIVKAWAAITLNGNFFPDFMASTFAIMGDGD